MTNTLAVKDVKRLIRWGSGSRPQRRGKTTHWNFADCSTYPRRKNSVVLVFVDRDISNSNATRYVPMTRPCFMTPERRPRTSIFSPGEPGSAASPPLAVRVLERFDLMEKYDRRSPHVFVACVPKNSPIACAYMIASAVLPARRKTTHRLEPTGNPHPLDSIPRLRSQCNHWSDQAATCSR